MEHPSPTSQETKKITSFDVEIPLNHKNHHRLTTERNAYDYEKQQERTRKIGVGLSTGILGLMMGGPLVGIAIGMGSARYWTTTTTNTPDHDDHPTSHEEDAPGWDADTTHRSKSLTATVNDAVQTIGEVTVFVCKKVMEMDEKHTISEKGVRIGKQTYTNVVDTLLTAKKKYYTAATTIEEEEEAKEEREEKEQQETEESTRTISPTNNNALSLSVSMSSSPDPIIVSQTPVSATSFTNSNAHAIIFDDVLVDDDDDFQMINKTDIDVNDTHLQEEEEEEEPQFLYHFHPTELPRRGDSSRRWNGGIVTRVKEYFNYGWSHDTTSTNEEEEPHQNFYPPNNYALQQEQQEYHHQVTLY